MKVGQTVRVTHEDPHINGKIGKIARIERLGERTLVTLDPGPGKHINSTPTYFMERLTVMDDGLAHDTQPCWICEDKAKGSAYLLVHYRDHICATCGRDINSHNWAIHPHHGHNPENMGCVAYTEAIDESFED